MGLYPQTIVNADLYTPLFCEENIWQLAQAFVREGVAVDTLQVIFISNRERQVVLFNQRNGAELGHVVWDYHVVLRRNDGTADRIYDFDSQLPFPCNTLDYLEATFGLQSELHDAYRAQLRLIPAKAFLQRLYSDRTHMHGVVAEAAWPLWPAITPEVKNAIKLERYWQMEQMLDDGSRVMSVVELTQRLEQMERRETAYVATNI